ncbi:hypothetical protein Lser_V15G45567 [Lactuca serriola]
MVDILLRLHVKTIIHCNFVCKKWLYLVSNSYFANLHLSRSLTSLMSMLKWVEIKDECGNPKLSPDSEIHTLGLVDGLLCLWQVGHSIIYICNPITIEYIIFPRKHYYRQGLKDGTILMPSYKDKVFAYCPHRKTIVDMEIFDRYFNGLPYRPSFHRLHNFENERVRFF